MKKAAVILCLLVCGLPSFSSAQPKSCTDKNIHIELEKAQASAGFFANLRGSDDSIKVQSDRILERSTRAIAKLKKPDTGCPSGCVVGSEPKIIFHAAPNKFISGYDDEVTCGQHLKKTTEHPLQWLNGTFEDYKEFSERFSEFSQGDGTYGEELYEKCDGDCSPQYTIRITPHPGEKYGADVFVVCGHARDKDDAMYTLTTTLVWGCEDRK